MVVVHKFGGACTGTVEALQQLTRLVSDAEKPLVMTVSAASGVTDFLREALEQVMHHEINVSASIKLLTERHVELLPKGTSEEGISQLRKLISQVERLLFGISYTEELTPRTRDLVLSFGERLMAVIIHEYLQKEGIDALIIDPTELIVTDGVHGDAMALLEETEKLAKSKLREELHQHPIIIVPGFFGKSLEDHSVTLLGRSGTDYTATVLACALDAEKVIIWKEVQGFMSADPRIIPDAHNVPELSYEEAAELAHFGAKVLHPLAVPPARLKRIPIEIRHFYHPKTTTTIREGSNQKPTVIKSVSYLRDLAVLKIYATLGGHTRGVLAKIAASLENAGINVISIATSQTCIAFLLKKESITAAVKSIEHLKPRLIDSWIIDHDFALICVVGDGLAKTPGIAARVFNAVARERANVELISAGASHAAYHFTVKNQDLSRALKAVHDEFFCKTLNDTK